MAASTLVVLEATYAVSRLSADDPLPKWAKGGPFLSITRTPVELSVVCREQQVPPDVKSERGWRCLRIAGPIDFGAVGILDSLIEPMARAGIPVFVVLTFDTDYLLVKGVKLDGAVDALRNAGHTVEL